MNHDANIKAAVTVDGRDYVIVPRAAFDRLTQLARAANLPELPERDADGDYPAVPYARSLLSRKLIRERVAAGMTQRELARRAGIRFETLCRLEAGRHTPSIPTIEKLERAMRGVIPADDAEDAGKPGSARRPVRRGNRKDKVTR
ncbi:MAG: helix-turn-helix domain-containing protein [Phycisphaerales bacterium]|nr:helix-turn-helix domain-containing protein [Phycisphaerales bacterium]